MQRDGLSMPILHRSGFSGVHTGHLLSADTLALHDILLQLFQRPHILSFADRSNSSLLVVSGYFAYTDNLQALSDHFTAIIDYQELFDYSQITLHQLINYGFIVILGLLGTIHFIHSSYADKIRTRMIYDSFITLSIVTWVFMILQPQHENELCGIMIANTAPLIAHFITFTKGKITNIAFIAIILITMLITLFNIFMPPVALLQ